MSTSPTTTNFVLIGLGSNLGNRETNLIEAIRCIDQRSILTDIACSAVYETPALLPENAPAEWNIPFLNIVISGMTDIEPTRLLKELKGCETDIGRQAAEKWAPRPIDLDILLYADYMMESPSLVVPHQYFMLRDFVIIPAADVAGDIMVPGTSKTIREYAESFKDPKAVRYADPLHWRS